MKKRIMFVDDEPNVLQGLRRNLRRTRDDWDSRFVNGGKEALDLLETFKPDLIVCDVMMPEMSGYDLLDLLRQEPQTAMIPFMFLTGNNDKPSMRRGMELGADDYLTKPCSASDLIKAIKIRFQKKEAHERHSEERLNSLRRNIVFSLPHELRTPLTGIQGIAELIMEAGNEIEPEQIMELAKSIHDASIRFERLIENYLVYAQIEILETDAEELAVLQATKISNAASIITVVAQQRARAADREQDLILDIANHEVHISEENLKKVTEETVENAFKFSEPGTPVKVSSKVGDAYEICITDNGRGMTEDQIKGIGAYMQFDRQLYEQQGSGLGLVIAKRLIEIHQGCVSISSIPDQELNVCIQLRI